MNTTIELADARQNGAYLVGNTDLDPLDTAAHATGLLVRRASLFGCRDKLDLLRRVAVMLDFPATFGANWDALADCLNDLAWLPHTGGYAWLFDHADALRAASEPDFDTLCAILDDACARWNVQGTPCFAFLSLPQEDFPRRA